VRAVADACQKMQSAKTVLELPSGGDCVYCCHCMCSLFWCWAVRSQGEKAKELMCWACATNVSSRISREKLNPGATPTQVSYYHKLSREDASSVVRLCTAYHESNVVNFRDPVVNLTLVAKPFLHEGWLPAGLRQVPNLEKECSVLGFDIKDIQGEEGYNVTPMPATHQNEGILCQVLARLKKGSLG
jgi:hypothetical protein